MKGQYKLFFALLVVFAAGLGLGRLTAPDQATTPAGTGTHAVAPERKSAPPPVPVPTAPTSPTVAAAGSSVAEEALDRVLANTGLSDPRAALERYGFNWRGEVEPAVDFVIDQMSDDELMSVISSLTNLTESEVSSVRDLREFASRLSSVAFDGVFSEPEPSAPEVGAVTFSTRVTPENAAEQASENFEVGDDRIYAVFPSEGYRHDKVLAKWYRRDRPALLMLETHAIDPDDNLSYVWFKPDAGWEPGEYGVEFYTTDDDVEQIATGYYTVR